MMPQGAAELVHTLEGRLRRFEDDGDAAAIVSDAADQEAQELLHRTFGTRTEPGVRFFIGTARALLARLYWARFLSRDSVSTDDPMARVTVSVLTDEAEATDRTPAVALSIREDPVAASDLVRAIYLCSFVPVESHDLVPEPLRGLCAVNRSISAFKADRIVRRVVDLLADFDSDPDPGTARRVHARLVEYMTYNSMLDLDPAHTRDFRRSCTVWGSNIGCGPSGQAI